MTAYEEYLNIIKRIKGLPVLPGHPEIRASVDTSNDMVHICLGFHGYHNYAKFADFFENGDQELCEYKSEKEENE